MSEGEQGTPWDRLYRADPKSGFAYPVKPARIADALVSTGARVGSLSLIVPRAEGRLGPQRPDGLLLAYADWQERQDMPFQGVGGSLAVYAVPTERREEVHALLLAEVLPGAAAWLAWAAAQGQVWREMRHERWYTLGVSGVVVEDREGGAWSTVRRA
jgi:hypothetical protein